MHTSGRGILAPGLEKTNTTRLDSHGELKGGSVPAYILNRIEFRGYAWNRSCNQREVLWAVSISLGHRLMLCAKA